jgi:anti-sigma factor RsiW
MTREQLEFQISQYVDGTLSPAEVAALSGMLASDAEARALLEDFRKVDATLKTTELPLPAINWDRFADHISAAVAEEDRATTSTPIRAWWVRRIAIAAAVLIVVGTVILWPRPAGHDQFVTGGNPAAAAVAIVQISGPEAATAPAVATVSIDDSPAMSQQANYRIAEDIIYRQPRVVIASGQADRQDTPSRLPY